MTLTNQSKAQTVLITGAASGIGKALAEAYLEQGHKVIGIDVNEALAEALLANYKDNLSFIYADLSQLSGIKIVLEGVLGIGFDVLIHSAGINYVASFGDSSLSKQKKVLDINLKAPIILSQELLKNEQLKRGSSLVFVSSLSHQASYPGAAVYAASKEGLTSFARSLGVVLASKGVHVLTVFPGPTRTPHAFEHSPDNSREAKRMPPEVLAQKIIKAVNQKRFRLVPSFALQVFATLGTYFPFISERIMVKMLYIKMREEERRKIKSKYEL